jgi:transposase
VIVDYYSQRIICTSFAPGKTHDFALFKQQAIKLNPATVCAVDSGYQGIAELHQPAYCPKKASKHHPLTPNQKAYNRTLCGYRILVENMICKLKVFRILSCRYRNRRRRFGLRFNLIAGILNREIDLKLDL